MNKLIKDDIQELLKRYKRAKSEKEKILCVKDLSNIFDAALKMQSEVNLKMQVPTELAQNLAMLDDLMKNEKDDITKQIYDNLDTLENIYTTFLKEFRKYHFTYKKIERDECVDLDVFHNFFKQFGNMDQEFTNIINKEYLFLTEGHGAGSAINFKILDKQYIFVSVNDFVSASTGLSHEMGHVHAFNITYDNNIDDYNFLTEFMSFLIEICYFNYEQSNLSVQDNIDFIYVVALLVYQSLIQIELMKKHPDAFVTFKLNSKYEEEFNKMRGNFNYEHHKNSLYSQIYSIDYLLAFNFFYQLKYGVDFNEIEKFYIENNCKNDLSSILKNIDMDAIKQYLQELYDQKKRSK